MKEIIKRQANNMILLYENAKKIEFPEERLISIDNLKSFTMNDLDKEFENIENDNAIYIISSYNFKLSHEEVKNLFDKRKKDIINYHISKINEAHFWKKRNNEYIIYVGSKEKNIKKRIIEHLGLNNTGRTTYSLYLKDWFPANTNITIRIWSLSKSIFYNAKYELLQILEDLIWEEYKPLFGKKGATFNKKNTAPN